jgi:AcrR family transcriptional regulator
MESPHVNRTLGSRRERPAKPALTRDGIIAAALDILRAEGLKKVTMRRIAAALDTGPASLYVYVRNTEDMHAQILDALLSSIDVPESGVWRDRLKGLLTSYARVLFDYPEIARMTMSTQPSGPNYLTLAESILALLHEGGVPDREASWAVDLLLLYPTAHAVERGARTSATREAEEFSALETSIAAADSERHPNIARLGDDLLSGGPERFAWGLDVLLNGVLASPRMDLEQGRS